MFIISRKNLGTAVTYPGTQIPFDKQIASAAKLLRGELREVNLKLLPQEPYSPNLAYSDENGFQASKTCSRASDFYQMMRLLHNL